MTATQEPVRCSHCTNDDPNLLEKISRPLWAVHALELWYCKVCGRTFPQKKPEH